MYQALYRKYRPQTFDDVSGQLAVTQTLKTQLITGKMSHAYLFTGSRGTGKTSCAKILAKAVNCLNPRDGNPCNCCEACRSIDSGACMDVLEIDAASNNLDIQEFMIVPVGFSSFADALRAGTEIYHALGAPPKKAGKSRSVGYAGGLAPELAD